MDMPFLPSKAALIAEIEREKQLIADALNEKGMGERTSI